MAAHLAPEADRGRVLGRIMSGLLLGILLSRTVSGFVGTHLGGWRVVFGGASGLMLALGALLAWQLPRNYPSFRGTYAELMRSLGTLVRELPLHLQGGFVQERLRTRVQPALLGTEPEPELRMAA